MHRIPYLLAVSFSTRLHQPLQLQSASDTEQQHYRLKSRDQHLQEIQSNEYDVIIVGGGSTGAGIALDCGLRGLKSVMLESSDFASGASSKSTKLIHGGVRYLQQVFQWKEKNRMEKFSLVAESLKERSNFMKMCGYLTKDFPTLIPCSNVFQLGYYYMGSLVYHMIYMYYSDKDSYSFKAPRIVGKDEIQSNFQNAKCSYGVLYYDGQFNDTRMVQDLILTASTKGQNVANYVEVNDLLKDVNGKIIGVRATDKIKNNSFNILGKVVVNATGCYADTLRLKDDPKQAKRIIPVGGSHIIFPQSYGSKTWGYLIPKTTDGRVMYILPWLGNVLVGTTERKFDQATNDPTVNQDELIWLVREYCSEFKVDPAVATTQVKSKWCGIRPLVLTQGTNSQDTKEISRTHVIEVSDSGLVSVMGGKWTIFRLMAEQTMDRVSQIIGSNKKVDYTGVKLVGDKTTQWQNEMEKMISMSGLPQAYANYFLSTYGDRAYDVLKVMGEKKENLERLHPQFPHTRGEIIYQIRYEQACKPEDVLLRRTRMGFLDQQSMFTVYDKVFKIFAEELKWSEKYQKEYLKENFHYIRSLEY